MFLCAVCEFFDCVFRDMSGAAERTCDQLDRRSSCLMRVFARRRINTSNKTSIPTSLCKKRKKQKTKREVLTRGRRRENRRRKTLTYRRPDKKTGDCNRVKHAHKHTLHFLRRGGGRRFLILVLSWSHHCSLLSLLSLCQQIPKTHHQKSTSSYLSSYPY